MAKKDTMPKKETWTLDGKRFSYYKSKECKAPSATWSLSDLFACINGDEYLKTFTERAHKVLLEFGGESKEFKKLKGQLPAVTASAVMNGVDKKEENIEALSGLIVLDIDNHSEADTRELKETLKADTCLPWVCAFESIRHGAKVLCAYDHARYSTRQAYRAYAAYAIDNLGVDEAQLDKVCGNPTRLTYICHDPELVSNPEFTTLEKDAFPMDEWLARADELFGKTRGGRKVAKSPVKTVNEDTQTAETESDALCESEEKSHALKPIRQNLLIAAKYVEWFKIHVCDTYEDYFHLVSGMSHDFPSDGEVKEACRAICLQSVNYDEANFEQLYSGQSDDVRGEGQEIITSRTSYAMCVEAIGKSDPWLKGFFSSRLDYDKLPRVMARLKELDDSPVFNDLHAVAALCLFGAANPFSYLKANGQKGTPNMFALFVGTSASNKSKLNDVFCMPKKVDRELGEKTKQEEAEWQTKAAENPNIPKPYPRMFSIACDITPRGLYNTLDANNGEGCLITSETQSLVTSKNKKNAFSDFNSMLCKCYESETVDLARSEGTVNIDNPRLSFVGTGTPKVLESMMNAEAFESGFASRCMVFRLPDEASDLDFGERYNRYANSEKLGTKKYLDDYFYDFYKMGKQLRKSVLVKTSDYQDALLQRYSYSAKVYLHDYLYLGDGYTHPDHNVQSLLNRGIDRLLRIITTLAALERFEKRRVEGKTTFFDGEAPKEITVSDYLVHAAILIDKVCMEQTFKTVEPMTERMRECEIAKAKKEFAKKCDRMEEVFKLLPDTFTTKDIQVRGGVGHSRANDFKKMYVSRGWVVKRGTSYVKQQGTSGAAASAV